MSFQRFFTELLNCDNLREYGKFINPCKTEVCGDSYSQNKKELNGSRENMVGISKKGQENDL